jgi:hypothetical protein
MDWQSLSASMFQNPDRDYPARTLQRQALARVRDGTLYDHITFPFSSEVGSGGEYIALTNRRPSVRLGSALCRTVVDDAVSLLFSEGHWPKFQGDQAAVETLATVAKECFLNQVMIDAATRGSVGSVAIELRVIESRLFFRIFDTWFLTPAWQPNQPDTLMSVTEKYKVRGSDLAAQGYKIEEAGAQYWFKRQWTDAEEIWFIPWLVSRPEDADRRDETKTVRHALGFVPMVWVRNLPGGDEIDGICTFQRGLDDCIEIDYLLSQGGRALKYASDPKLVIKDSAGDDAKLTGGAANALIIATDGDAKLLEINGSSAKAMLEHYQELRQAALQAMHGNRANPDKMSAAQSGRAMELLNQGLIWLSDKLRISYGEGALLALARMICDASAKMPLKIGGKAVNNLSAKDLGLVWPAWHAPTYADMQQLVTALAGAVVAGIISHETATRMIAPTCDIEDLDAEIAKIKAEQIEEDARLARQAAQTKANETVS